MPWGVEVIDNRPPSLIGTEWYRREPKGDEWDCIVIRGVFYLGEIDGMEFTVSPKSFGQTISCTAASLADAYTQAEGGGRDVLADLQQRLRHIEGGGVGC